MPLYSPPRYFRVTIFTVLTLLAFAANSVLCRLALGEGLIDAAGFTIVRLLSGAFVLTVLMLSKHRALPKNSGSWKGGAYLALYAIAFSYAYVSIDTGTGALVLFAAVQLSMLFVGIWKGDRLQLIEWLGVILAFSGLVYLLLPSLQTPSLQGFILMLLAGTAWGFYSLNGRGSAQPLLDTAGNFIRTLPVMFILALCMWSQLHMSSQGVALAVASGALASALGYTLWYMVLPALPTTFAAVVQLLVPLLAALGGVLFVGEAFSLNLVVAGMLTLGGVLLVILKPSFK